MSSESSELKKKKNYTFDLDHWYLQYCLATGLYMLEPWERKLFNSFVLGFKFLQVINQMVLLISLMSFLHFAVLKNILVMVMNALVFNVTLVVVSANNLNIMSSV
uniref:Uncharacterized protein n=1 Tax=Panagrolaimus sp. PS1159 TaxID=55785 RepID=A0AC35FXG1_9BILA